MNDREIEEILRRVRPAGPPADLRARILSAPLPVRRAWPWGIAAAALLVITVGLPAADARAARALAAGETPWDVERKRLTEMLGGDPEAESRAGLVVRANQLRAASVDAARSPAPLANQ